ncbi:protein FRA10AC1 [Apis mellifera caucasica]|uniref:Protein FRA10AC1 n=1 Tax=Apis mellifera TaxID=7460 RepID=A0A7M7G2G0_APIME|nr:protein FRA10AC1 [Apis mellifera]KAG6795170.1 protein FRA10AC1 [Apis mellifera caucasica]KAG9428585.1 protein FRA10AC1 [Apis mellifera carnica]|eukprot:XP_001122241.2 protein FRA10AC1 [Apis mellifera]
MFPAYSYLSAYDRHKKLINDYFTLYGGSVSSLERDTSRDKTDYDVIKENHRFLWDQDKDEPNTWGARLAKKYYDKLFKEYCIADLTYYKQNKVALRWRIEKEVIIGKGQFECGNKKCKNKEQLKSWEVNFGYIEHGQKKNALVKLRLCPECSIKLNYRSQKREAKKHKILKRLGTNIETFNNTPSTSTVQIKIEENKTINNIEKSIEEKDESKIWKEKPTEDLEKTREEEFEEYLADLLI